MHGGGGDSLLWANRNTEEEIQEQKTSLISNHNSNVAGGAWNCEPSLGQQKYGTENVEESKEIKKIPYYGSAQLCCQRDMKL